MRRRCIGFNDDGPTKILQQIRDFVRGASDESVLMYVHLKRALRPHPSEARHASAAVMRQEPSIHDSRVYAYYVDCEGRRVVLHTVFRDQEPHEYTDVVFRGVVAHQFERVLDGNILFDIDDLDVATFVRENGALFADSWRYGWPPVDYNGDMNKLVDAFNAASARAYTIQSSYGLSGWVVAAGCDRVSRSDAARVA